MKHKIRLIRNKIYQKLNSKFQEQKNLKRQYMSYQEKII